MNRFKKMLFALRSVIEFPEDETEDAPALFEETAGHTALQTEKSGISTGSFSFDGAEQDELLAVILAAICESSSLPMRQIRIQSIKAI